MSKLIHYSFRVEVTIRHRLAKEVTIQLDFTAGSTEDKKLRKAASEVQEVVFSCPLNQLIAPNDMCAFDTLSDICYQIEEDIIRQYLEAWEIEVTTITKQDIDSSGFLFKIEFPPELLYAYIRRQNDYLIMEDCLSFNLDIIKTMRTQEAYINARLCDPPSSNCLDSVFDRFDVPMIRSLAASRTGPYETITLTDGTITNYLLRHKEDHRYFGISFSVENTLPKVNVPEFCKKARLLLFQKFIIGRRNVKAINTLLFQLEPVNSDELSLDGEKVIPNELAESFSQMDSWYYEMCTGISLSLAITAQLLVLDEIDCPNPWKKYRIPVFLKLLKKYYPLFVSCPAIYWRIEMLLKIIQIIDSEMRRTVQISNFHYIAGPDFVGPPSPAHELELFSNADDIFCRSFEVEFAHRLQPVDYCGTLRLFPKILVAEANLYNKSSQKVSGTAVASDSEVVQYDPFMFCLKDNHYISKIKDKVQGIMNLYKGSYSHRTRYRAETKEEKMFDQVHKALYPYGFMDLEA